MNLTFYMFEKSIQTIDEAINVEKFFEFEELQFREPVPFEARAFLKKNKTTVPNWVSYIRDYLVIDQDEIRNTTNSLVVFVKHKDRVFAVTKGYGFTAIDRHRLEKNFGLKVALNSIDPTKIRMIDLRRLDITTKQKREFLSRNSPLYEFDFETDVELLKLISGVPTNTNLAKKFSGADSISISTDIEFLEIGTKCGQLLDEYSKDDYKANFPFIDYMQPITDISTIETLDQMLLSSLSQQVEENITLAYPEILKFEDIDHFEISQGDSHGRLDEVDLESVYRFFSGIGIQRPLTEIKIAGYDDNKIKVTRDFSLYEFCVFEVPLNDERYILSLEKWFQVASDYIAEVNSSFANLEEIPEGFLPPMMLGQREDEYNEQSASSDVFILLDKRFYRVEARGKIEVCDLLSRDAEFICVKKYNSSATLSHLFSQGLVSSELLVDEPTYRKFILDQCPLNFAEFPFSQDSIDQKKITFVFAIAMNGDLPLVDMLPFFSKVRLRQTKRSIERMGYEVKLHRIPIVESSA